MSGHWDETWSDAVGAIRTWHECVPDGHVCAVTIDPMHGLTPPASPEPTPGLREALDMLDELEKQTRHGNLAYVSAQQIALFRAALAASPAPEPDVDEAGLPITHDAHSRDWFEGYAAKAAEAAPEPTGLDVERLAGLERVATAALNVVTLPPHIEAYSHEDRRRIWTNQLSEAIDALPRAARLTTEETTDAG